MNTHTHRARQARRCDRIELARVVPPVRQKNDHAAVGGTVLQPVHRGRQAHANGRSVIAASDLHRVEDLQEQAVVQCQRAARERAAGEDN